MRIAGLQKLTLLDYPGKTAATVFTPGCNFRCPFCHNANLVLGTGVEKEGRVDTATNKDSHTIVDIPLGELFIFLEKRRGLLDGVCITGGEPLMQAGLAEFCQHVHDASFAVKLDTNGSFPKRLQALLDANLVDYVAMDVKNTPARYAETVGMSDFSLAPILESVALLQEGHVPFEFRTTVVRELHDADDLRAIAHWIGDGSAWFLQSYLDTEGVLAGPGRFHPWSPNDLHALLPDLQVIAPGARLRGVD